MNYTLKSIITNFPIFSWRNKSFLLIILIFGLHLNSNAQTIAFVSNVKNIEIVENNSNQNTVIESFKFGEDDVIGFANAKVVGRVGNLSIQLKNFHREKVEITLFTEIGEILYSVFVEPKAPSCEVSPFDTILTKGKYFIKVKGIRNIITQDVVVR